MTKTFNNGKIIVTDDTISVKRFFKEIVIKRQKIRNITYKYNNVIYKVLHIPLGLFYCITIIGIPVGIHCLGGDMMVYIETSHESFSFWVSGNDIKEFRIAIQ